MPASPTQLRQLIDRKLPDGEAPFARQFAALLFEKAPRELREELTPDIQLGITLSALEFIGKRAPDEVLARAYSPSLETHGWEAPYSALEICLTDRPFIVDSVRAAISRSGFHLHHYLHPILHVDRDAGGRLRKKGLDRKDGGTAEAYELFLVEATDEQERLEALEARIREVLGDVVLATGDYRDMRERAEMVRNYLVDLELRLDRGGLATDDGPAEVQ